MINDVQNEERTIQMDAGTSLVIRTVVKGPTGEAINLAGAKAVWIFKRDDRAQGADVYVRKVCDIDTVSDNGVLFWRISTKLNPSDTDRRRPGIYYHECKVRRGPTDINEVSSGPWIINASMPNSELD